MFILMQATVVLLEKSLKTRRIASARTGDNVTQPQANHSRPRQSKVQTKKLNPRKPVRTPNEPIGRIPNEPKRPIPSLAGASSAPNEPKSRIAQLPTAGASATSPVHTQSPVAQSPAASANEPITTSRLTALQQKTDEQLLAAYRNGDKASFNILVERYQRELFHFLIRFLGDRAAAEDIFQEAFLQVHQSAAQFDTDRRFRPWLFTIAANKARDLIRARARRPTSPLQASISSDDEDSGQFIDLIQSDQAMPYEPLEQQELRQQVHKTVMGMPDHLREILLLSYFHQFPYKQISDILSIPLGTVKSRLHSAVAHFADKWHHLNHTHSAS